MKFSDKVERLRQTQEKTAQEYQDAQKRAVAARKKYANAKFAEIKNIWETSGPTPDTLRELDFDYHTRSHELLHRWVTSLGQAELTTQGMVQRPSDPDKHYPPPHITLRRDQEIANSLVLALVAFCALIDEAVIQINMLEYTLSEHGSYWVEYIPASGDALIKKITYGHTETLHTGTLHEILAIAARRYYYYE